MPCPAGHPVVSVPKSPSVVCRHQLSIAACAFTRSSSIPHLHAAQRRICSVVPVNCPSTRDARPPGNIDAGTRCPVVWLERWLTRLFSAIGRERTQAAHRLPEGKYARGGKVPKCAGTAAVVGCRDGTRAGAAVAVDAGGAALAAPASDGADPAPPLPAGAGDAPTD